VSGDRLVPVGAYCDACCDICFKPVSLVLTRSVRLVETAQEGVSMPKSHSY